MDAYVGISISAFIYVMFGISLQAFIEVKESDTDPQGKEKPTQKAWG